MKKILIVLIFILMLFFGCDNYKKVDLQEDIVNINITEFTFLNNSELKNGFQSIVLIGEELWVGWASNDTHTNRHFIKRYNFETMTLIGKITHNLGHLNTMDYNEELDALIIGNGSNDYSLPLKVYIFHNVSKWKLLEDVDFNTISKTVIDLSSISESKANAVWGEKSDIFYLITNDNAKIRKCQLGKGASQLTYGIYNDTVGLDEYNGTMKVIEEYNQPLAIDVNQDSAIYNGKLYVATGHSKIVAHEISFFNGNKTKVRRFEVQVLNSEGIYPSIFSEGIIVKNGKIFHGYIGADGYGIVSYDIPL